MQKTSNYKNNSKKVHNNLFKSKIKKIQTFKIFKIKIYLQVMT